MFYFVARNEIIATQFICYVCQQAPFPAEDITIRIYIYTYKPI